MGNDNESIKRAIQMLSKAGEIKDLRVLTGFVTDVHSEIDSDNYGTFDFRSTDGRFYIKDVSTSSINDNRRGRIEMPAEDSDVTIIWVNESRAYVLNYSHISDVLINADKVASIGASGLEDTDDDTDYDEVEETGKSSKTIYTPDSTVTSVNDIKDSSTLTTETTITSTSAETSITSSESSDYSTVTQSLDKVTLDVGGALMEHEKGSTKITSPQITLSNGGATEKAVKGETLSVVLKALVDQIALITTATAMGVQPILNAAAVTALKAQIDTILSNVNLIE